MGNRSARTAKLGRCELDVVSAMSGTSAARSGLKIFSI